MHHLDPDDRTGQRENYLLLPGTDLGHSSGLLAVGGVKILLNIVDWNQTSGMALMKSGWLWRQSSFLKRWKMNWCDLWMDGSLVFYKTESRRDHESRVSLKSQCVDVKVGLECTEGHPKENLLVLVLRDRSSIAMCASSEDESLAWKLTMMEAKRNPVYMYNPYDDGYQYVTVDSHNAIYINPEYANGGVHHILVHQQRRDGLGEQVALGLLAGMAAGAAMRSFLWMPFWFC